MPGAFRTQRSAFDAVSDWRGSTWTNRPARPSLSVCMCAKLRLYSTVESHVSMKSAPKERTVPASSKA